HDYSHRLAATVREADAVVVVERRGTIDARIDDQRCRLVARLIGILFHRPQWQDRTGPHVQWHRREIDRSIDLAATLKPLLRPEVEPAAARQIELPVR